MDSVESDFDVVLVWSVILMSIGYIFFISKCGEPPVKPSAPLPKIRHLTRAKELRKARHLEAQRLIPNTISFPLLRLPPEITSLILKHCVDWPGTYLSLTQVSRRVQKLAFYTCLPRILIQLTDERQIPSFDLFLRKNPQLSPLVRNLWLAPMRIHLVEEALRILKACINVQSLASFSFIIREAIALRGVVRHRKCRQLTMLYTNEVAWKDLLGAPGGPAFFQQLTHLRLVRHYVPENTPLPKLTHLSYALDRAESNVSIGKKMLRDVKSYPSLHTVIVTRGLHDPSLVLKRSTTLKIFTFDAPSSGTEINLWCNNVHRRGMWEVSAELTPTQYCACGCNGDHTSHLVSRLRVKGDVLHRQDLR